VTDGEIPVHIVRLNAGTIGDDLILMIVSDIIALEWAVGSKCNRF
jgi:hypothetical protein